MSVTHAPLTVSDVFKAFENNRSEVIAAYLEWLNKEYSGSHKLYFEHIEETYQLNRTAWAKRASNRPRNAIICLSNFTKLLLSRRPPRSGLPLQGMACFYLLEVNGLVKDWLEEKKPMPLRSQSKKAPATTTTPVVEPAALDLQPIQPLQPLFLDGDGDTTVNGFKELSLPIESSIDTAAKLSEQLLYPQNYDPSAAEPRPTTDFFTTQPDTEEYTAPPSPHDLSWVDNVFNSSA